MRCQCSVLFQALLQVMSTPKGVQLLWNSRKKMNTILKKEGPEDFDYMFFFYRFYFSKRKFSWNNWFIKAQAVRRLSKGKHCPSFLINIYHLQVCGIGTFPSWNRRFVWWKRINCVQNDMQSLQCYMRTERIASNSPMMLILGPPASSIFMELPWSNWPRPHSH